MNNSKTETTVFERVFELVKSFLGFDISTFFSGTVIIWFWCWGVSCFIKLISIQPSAKDTNFLSNEHSTDIDSRISMPITWISNLFSQLFGNSPNWLSGTIRVIENLPQHDYMFFLGIFSIMIIGVFSYKNSLDYLYGKTDDDSNIITIHSTTLLLVMFLAEYSQEFSKVFHWILLVGIIPFLCFTTFDLFICIINRSKFSFQEIFANAGHSLLIMFGWLLSAVLVVLYFIIKFCIVFYSIKKS